MNQAGHRVLVLRLATTIKQNLVSNEECPTDPRTLAAHRSSPRRGSRVVDSVEVLDPIEGEGASWRRIGGGLPDGGRRYRFSLVPCSREPQT